MPKKADAMVQALMRQGMSESKAWAIANAQMAKDKKKRKAKKS